MTGCFDDFLLSERQTGAIDLILDLERPIKWPNPSTLLAVGQETTVVPLSDMTAAAGDQTTRNPPVKLLTSTLIEITRAWSVSAGTTVADLLPNLAIGREHGLSIRTQRSAPSCQPWHEMKG